MLWSLKWYWQSTLYCLSSINIARVMSNLPTAICYGQCKNTGSCMIFLPSCGMEGKLVLCSERQYTWTFLRQYIVTHRVHGYKVLKAMVIRWQWISYLQPFASPFSATASPFSATASPFETAPPTEPAKSQSQQGGPFAAAQQAMIGNALGKWDGAVEFECSSWALAGVLWRRCW